MNDNVFKTGNQLPQLLREVVGIGFLETMPPGQTIYSTSLALHVDSDARIQLSTSMVDHSKSLVPSPNGRLKVIKDFGGLIIDLTAFSWAEIKYCCTPHDSTAYRVPMGITDEIFEEVYGVLYPDINGTDGLAPPEVTAYNEEQTAQRRRFAAYYESTYGSPYQFASQEHQAAITPAVPTGSTISPNV